VAVVLGLGEEEQGEGIVGEDWRITSKTVPLREF
jgi:hypothetical protein